ncbi:MAG: lipid IV(A) 3-deoxy-D-manno-octulosonic acid transferase [Candidatus Thioglobus sp.]|uniref:lipid IV(A) 3-deoxy-D-manno-octulosonic acid transferase n=1 Tax=Candidatus Thioglobus sp. TaxID=2026721 RepID=UPI00260C9C58|nr:lipid IV(A) 3-deoxy-D-manno-octulosonic acid transferase [Candidatus Thioglobus sp.]MDC9727426.1 lipid IV(A) 3-deoxy-D-manno-octulosonic acid transferase [Candidatus Thioglobus sp.]
MKPLYHRQMNRTLYSLIGYSLLPVLIIRLLFKSIKASNYRQRIYERLGFVKKIPMPVIWIHCVSVGEFRASISLIDTLIKQYSNHRILVTSTTPTGSDAIKQHYHNKVLHLYFPFDLGFIVKRYIKQIKPELCILMETEIWPNLIHALKKNSIPSILVNARMSERSLKKYQQFAASLVKQTLNNLSLVATQNQNSADRFIQLGAPKNKVVNAGNIKFDQNPKSNNLATTAIGKITQARTVVTFASTHEGEEKNILQSFSTFKGKTDFLLVFVPRHPERFNQVEKLIKSYDLTIERRSSARSATQADALLGDSMGEMMSYFEVSDIVFMGGSLNDTGGHNMLEPAALSKPIIFGPTVFNFAEISADLLEQKASIQVNNADELFEQITQLLADKKQLKSLGDNAKQYFDSQQGAVNRLSKLIAEII